MAAFKNFDLPLVKNTLLGGRAMRQVRLDPLSMRQEISG